jgi:hypothetical protein
MLLVTFAGRRYFRCVQVMTFLLGTSWRVVLGCVLLGAWLLVTPRRIGTLLADGFGFQSRFASHAFVKVLLLRLAGLA